MEVDRVFQGVVSFTFVQTDLGATLQGKIEQPIEGEQRAFDPSDLPPCPSKRVPPRVSGQLSEILAGNNDTGSHRRSGPKHVRPAIRDEFFVERSSDEISNRVRRRRRRRRRIEGIEPIVVKAANTRRETESEHSTDGKDMIREAAGIREVLLDFEAAVVKEETVDDVGRFVRRRPDPLCMERGELVRDMSLG